ncbi:MAG: glycosyltransferase family 39 protein [Elusimicrobiota bacterium]
MAIISRNKYQINFGTGLILLGLILRIRQYLVNRSLWVDEAMLAFNILDRGVFDSLQYDQAAPPGFQALVKIPVEFLGSSEYILRLIPLLSGILSLILIFKITRRYVNKNAGLIALGLLAVSKKAIKFSAELKQYSTDILVALLIIYVLSRVDFEKPDFLKVVAVILFGSVILWFSFPAVFILCSYALVKSYEILSGKEWQKLKSWGIVFLTWASSFIIFYFTFLKNLTANENLQSFWKSSFWPFPPRSISDVTWLYTHGLKEIQDMAGTNSTILILVLLTAGSIVIYKKNKNLLFTLILPFILTLFASSLRKYPFEGRVILFLMPLVLIIAAAAAEYIIEKASGYHFAAGVLIAGTIFYTPVRKAGQQFINPRKVEEIRPVIKYIKDNRRENDKIYVYCGAAAAFKYYSKRFNLENDSYIWGVFSRDDKQKYLNQIDNLIEQGRMWFLFSHVHRDEKEYILRYVENFGVEKDSFTSYGAKAYLYKFKNIDN